MISIVLKLMKDLWLSKGKFLLCILSAAISSWGISGVIYCYLMAERDFETNFRSTLPSDFILSVEHSTPEIVQKVSNLSGVSTVESRIVLTGRIRSFNGGWMPIQLFLVDDFAHVRLNKFTIDDASRLDSGILIERNARGFINTGEALSVLQFTNADSLQVARIGVIHDPGLAPAQMERVVYAYAKRTKSGFPIREGQDRLLIKTTIQKPNYQQLKDFSANVEKLIEGMGGKISSVVIPQPGEHPHQGIIDGVSYLQKRFGFVLALLGTVLLSLTLLTWIYPQINQIGIMKSIGAPTGNILSSYLIILSFILIIGISIGLPLGHFSATNYNRFIAMVQNFEVVRKPLPILNQLVIFFICFIIPMMIAFVPLRTVSLSTANHAMTETFRGSNKRIFGLLQALLTTSKLKYGVNNLFRNGSRSILLVFLLSIGLALFFTGSSLEYSIYKDFSDNLNDSNYELMFSFSRLQSRKLGILDSVKAIESISYIKGEGVQFYSKEDGYKQNSTLRRYPPNYDLNLKYIIEGNWTVNCQECLYINQRLADDFKNISLGDSLFLTDLKGIEKKYVYSGIIKELGGNGFYVFDNQDTLYNILEIHCKQGTDYSLTADKVEKYLSRRGIVTAQTTNKNEMFEGLENHFAPSFLVIRYMGIVTILVALLGMLIVLNLIIQERTAEIGIVKALGGSVRDIIQLLQLEFLLITAVSILAGVGISYEFTSKLCGIYGRSLLGIGFNTSINYGVIVITILALLLLQSVIITGYTYYKLKSNVQLILNQIA